MYRIVSCWTEDVRKIMILSFPSGLTMNLFFCVPSEPTFSSLRTEKISHKFYERIRFNGVNRKASRTYSLYPQLSLLFLHKLMMMMRNDFLLSRVDWQNLLNSEIHRPPRWAIFSSFAGKTFFVDVAITFWPFFLMRVNVEATFNSPN